jgi:hypothetical protein
MASTVKLDARIASSSSAVGPLSSASAAAISTSRIAPKRASSVQTAPISGRV